MSGEDSALKHQERGQIWTETPGKHPETTVPPRGGYEGELADANSDESSMAEPSASSSTASTALVLNAIDSRRGELNRESTQPRLTRAAPV